MIKCKKDVGIAGQFPHYSYMYTVGPYGSGPTTDYSI